MRYVSIEIKPEEIIGKAIKALIERKPLQLRANENDKEGNEYRPDYKSFDGVALWMKEE